MDKYIWGIPTSMGHSPETPYHHTIYIVEFYNTISNLLLIIYPILYINHCSRIQTEIGYMLLANAGLCSMIQHGTMLWWSRYVDYFGISMVILWCIQNKLWQYICPEYVIMMSIVFLISVLDNHRILTLIPPPIIHSFWHISIAILAHLIGGIKLLLFE